MLMLLILGNVLKKIKALIAGADSIICIHILISVLKFFKFEGNIDGIALQALDSSFPAQY